MDNWTILHPSNEFYLFNSSSYLSKFRIYTYFINNQQTANHHSIIYGLRELNLNELKKKTISFFRKLLNLNLFIRLFLSG